MSSRVTLFFCAAILTAACGGDSVAPPPPPPPPTFSGQIETRYASADIPPSVDAAVKFAVDKWTRAIHKNLGDFHLQATANECFIGEPNIDEIHHNLLVFVAVLYLDGPHNGLAVTNVCQLSDRDMLPVLSVIRIDRDDVSSMEANGTLQGAIMHEMGHALGFNPRSYMPKGLGSGGPTDPVFVGSVARSEFAKHGAWYMGATVPLEDSRGIGPQDPHWRLSVFGDELMVPAIGDGFKSPLSSITLGFFEDIGYDVDFSVADPYEVAPLSVATRILPEANLKNDFEMKKPPTLASPIIRR